MTHWCSVKATPPQLRGVSVTCSAPTLSSLARSARVPDTRVLPRVTLNTHGLAAEAPKGQHLRGLQPLTHWPTGHSLDVPENQRPCPWCWGTTGW